MNVSLTPKLEDFVKRKVDQGSYSSISEVICEALRLLGELDAEKETKLVELRRNLQKGIDSLDRGEGKPLDMDEIIAKGKARIIKEAQV